MDQRSGHQGGREDLCPCVASRPPVSPCDSQVLTALQKDSREMEKGSPSLRH